MSATQKWGGFHLSKQSSDKRNIPLEGGGQNAVFWPPPKHEKCQFEGLCLSTMYIWYNTKSDFHFYFLTISWSKSMGSELSNALSNVIKALKFIEKDLVEVYLHFHVKSWKSIEISFFFLGFNMKIKVYFNKIFLNEF